MHYLKYFINRTAYLKNHLIDVYNWRDSAPRLGEVIWIPLESMAGMVKAIKSYNLSQKGTVISGDWDVSIESLEEKRLIKTLIEMYNGNYEARAVFKKMFEEKKDKNYANWKLKRAFNIFDNIKEKGFLPGKRILGGINTIFKDRSAIKVAITRNGEFAWVGSRHRTAAAIALKLEKVPVLVRWRHIEWQKIRKETKEKYKRGEIKKEDITHPDLILLFSKTQWN